MRSFFQTEDGETAWLSLNQMADLFDRDKSVISRHLRNIFTPGELDREAAVAKNATVHVKATVVKGFLTTARDGKTYKTKYYNEIRA